MRNTSRDAVMAPSRRLLRPVLAVFLGMAAMGAPQAILPPYLNREIGIEIDIIGWVLGIQSAATLLSRPLAGRIADRIGGQRAIFWGLVFSGLGGALILPAAMAVQAGLTSLCMTALVISRLASGIGEGFVITGGGLWAIHVAGEQKTGLAMSWVGLGMFAGLGAGAIVGSLAADLAGFKAACGVIAASSILGCTLAAGPVSSSVRHDATLAPSLYGVVRRIVAPGLALALSSVGLSAITSFSVLLYAAKGWSAGPDVLAGSTGAAIMAFSIGHIAARLLLGHKADRLTGAAAPILLTIEGLGLALFGMAANPAEAVAGAFLAGFGFSMIYPLMAITALARIPRSAWGLAIGCYDAFFDIAIGLGTTGGGLAAARLGLEAPFLLGAAAAVLAIVPTLLGRRRQPAIGQAGTEP